MESCLCRRAEACDSDLEEGVVIPTSKGPCSAQAPEAPLLPRLPSSFILIFDRIFPRTQKSHLHLHLRPPPVLPDYRPRRRRPIPHRILHQGQRAQGEGEELRLAYGGAGQVAAEVDAGGSDWAVGSEGIVVQQQDAQRLAPPAGGGGRAGEVEGAGPEGRVGAADHAGLEGLRVREAGEGRGQLKRLRAWRGFRKGGWACMCDLSRIQCTAGKYMAEKRRPNKRDQHGIRNSGRGVEAVRGDAAEERVEEIRNRWVMGQGSGHICRTYHGQRVGSHACNDKN